MIKFSCDKCGKVVTDSYGLSMRWSGVANIDLCDDCTADYDSTLKRVTEEAIKEWFKKH